MFKSFLKIALVLVVSLSVAGLLGEGVLRLTMKDRIVLFPRYHTDATYGEFQIRRFRPNSVFYHTSIDGRWRFSTNDKGFRNEKNFPYQAATDPRDFVAPALTDSPPPLGQSGAGQRQLDEQQRQQLQQPSRKPFDSYHSLRARPQRRKEQLFIGTKAQQQLQIKIKIMIKI